MIWRRYEPGKRFWDAGSCSGNLVGPGTGELVNGGYRESGRFNWARIAPFPDRQVTATTFQAPPMDRTAFQRPIQLPPSPPNRLHVHPGDLRQEPVAAMADFLRFQPHLPTSLLLIQTAEEQVHSSMQLPRWMVSQLLAVGTLALVYLCHPHFPSPPHC